MKKIVKGNDFTLKIPVMKMVEGQAQAFPLPACTDVVVQVCNQFRRIPLEFTIDVKEDNVLLARVEGDRMGIGTYAIEVKGKIFGNDWRSNEYPQFAIVSKNADADTEFCETDDGDNSVEMDTAMVILPPSVELSDLIDKTNEALKNNKETNDTLNANEEARKKEEESRVIAEQKRTGSEQSRVEAEEARVTAEDERTNAETSRVNAESERVRAEDTRAEIEVTRQSNELTRKDNEVKRVAAESERAKSEEARVADESSRVDAEAQRVSAENEREFAENGRASAEAERVQAEKKRQTDTYAAIGSMTERINTAIDEFNAHRTEFDEAETARVDAENSRVEAETARANAEKSRVTSENERVSAETDRAEAESNRQTESAKAVKAANDAAAQANATNESIKTNEQGRVDAETNRKSAEKSRNDNEGIRQESENERISQETERQTNEQKRVEAENKRIKAEADRVSAEGARSEAEQARADAETKRERDFDTAIQAAETATLGAERVNAELEGNVLKVTNRNGEVKSLDFEQWDLEEKVNISISTSVEGVSIKGVVVNVFLNGATTSTKYTSDAEGKISFAIPRGTIYKVSFQELKNCDPLPSLTYTAALRVRDINVEYKAISGETASVVVTIDKAENGAVKPLQGVPVTCEVTNGDTITTETGENGKVTFSIPWGKTYKITAGKPEGYYVFRGIYEKNNVADVAEHNLYYHFYPITSGAFILDTAGAQYTLDEWRESGKTAEDAVLVKITTKNLAEHNSSVGFSPSALQAGYPSKQWCTQNVLFNNIPENGNNTKDALYYEGYKSSKLIREEAQERGLTIPAFSYAYGCTVEMAGETLHGYVASVGQMAEMNINKTIIDEVIKVLYGDMAKLFSPLFTMTKWTSTQLNAASAWNFSSTASSYGSKSSSFVVLPVYAC